MALQGFQAPAGLLTALNPTAGALRDPFVARKAAPGDGVVEAPAPFDRVEARRAMLHLVDQKVILQATFVDPKYYRTCGAYFGCGTLMESDAATEWFTAGQDIGKAKELFRKADYGHRSRH